MLLWKKGWCKKRLPNFKDRNNQSGCLVIGLIFLLQLHYSYGPFSSAYSHQGKFHSQTDVQKLKWNERGLVSISWCFFFYFKRRKTNSKFELSKTHTLCRRRISRTPNIWRYSTNKPDNKQGNAKCICAFLTRFLWTNNAALRDFPMPCSIFPEKTRELLLFKF